MKNWRLTVNQLETLTVLDLFSNIPKDIQERIEDYSASVSIPITLSLLTDTESVPHSFGVNVLSSNSTIWHDSVAQGEI